MHINLKQFMLESEIPAAIQAACNFLSTVPQIAGKHVPYHEMQSALQTSMIMNKCKAAEVELIIYCPRFDEATISIVMSIIPVHSKPDEKTDTLHVVETKIPVSNYLVT